LRPEVKKPASVSVRWWGWSLDRFKFARNLHRHRESLDEIKAL